MDPSGIPVHLPLQIQRWEGNLYQRFRMWWTMDVMHAVFCSANGCYGHRTWGEWVPEDVG